MSFGGAHGWNIDIAANTNGSVLVRPTCGEGKDGSGRVCRSTLLGPEGPGYRIGGRRFFWTSVNIRTGASRQVLGEYRPYFENYTVDASILD